MGLRVVNNQNPVKTQQAAFGIKIYSVVSRVHQNYVIGMPGGITHALQNADKSCRHESPQTGCVGMMEKVIVLVAFRQAG